MRAVLSLFEKVVKLSRTLPDDSYIMAMNVDEPGWLADLIASTLPLDVPRRQEILETLEVEAVQLASASPHRGTGCLHCGMTGFRGRLGVFEVLPITSALRRAFAHETY